jgi:hypothetical protein
LLEEVAEAVGAEIRFELLRPGVSGEDFLGDLRDGDTETV